MRSFERDEASHLWVQTINECDQPKDRTVDSYLD